METVAAILAAGRGERMRISTPKPLFTMLGRPMLAYVLDALGGAGISKKFIITSPSLRPAVQGICGARSRIVLQPRPLGTGDAVMRLRPHLRKPSILVVINADDPLFEPGHVRALLAMRARTGAPVCFATALVEDPRGLGRVLRDPVGSVTNIVEESEAGDEVRRIREINAGLYAFETPVIFKLLSAVKPAGPRRESYLTRAVELAIARDLKVSTIAVPAESATGINTLSEAALAQSILQARKLAALMNSGVMVDDPSSVYTDWDVAVGAGTRILPGTMLLGTTRAGRECKLGPHSVIRDSRLGNRVAVAASWVTGSSLADGCRIGPFAHVRPGCRIERGARVGTHAETVRTRLGAGARMSHFSYMGDAVVGNGANIGAGAVAANFDGKRKWPTRIGRNAFIGSGSVLVAPASVGNYAVVGAGAIVPARRPVPAGSVFAGVPARRIAFKRRKKT